MVKLYGIKNCDTVKKAKKWLEEQGVDYTFVDFRVDGVDESLIQNWVDTLGFEGLVNKRSTTWKQLSDDQKGGLSTGLIMENITLIKRPVLVVSGDVSVGFSEKNWSKRL